MTGQVIILNVRNADQMETYVLKAICIFQYVGREAGSLLGTDDLLEKVAITFDDGCVMPASSLVCHGP